MKENRSQRRATMKTGKEKREVKRIKKKKYNPNNEKKVLR